MDPSSITDALLRDAMNPSMTHMNIPRAPDSLNG